MRFVRRKVMQVLETLLFFSIQNDLDEGLENINPENIEIVMKAVQHFASQPAVMSALAAGGLLAAVAKIKELMDTQN